MHTATALDIRRKERRSRFWWYFLPALLVFFVCVYAIEKNSQARYEVQTTARGVERALWRVEELNKAEAEIQVAKNQLRRGEGSLSLLEKAFLQRYSVAYDVDTQVRRRLYRFMDTLDSATLVTLIEREPSYFELLKYDSVTPAIVLAAGRSVSVVGFPPEYLTPELTEAFIRARPDNLRYLPSSVITPGLVTLAMMENVKMLRYVPDAMQTAELCQMAVAKDPSTLCLCRFDLRTIELSRLALASSNDAADCVPKKFFLSKLP